jgi:hypothetical protein
MRAAAACFLFLVALCLASPVRALEQAPIISEVLHGDYRSIAECAYERIDKLGETGVKKIDLPSAKKTKLLLDQNGVRYWEITFTGAGKATTSVEMSVVRTMWGPSKQYAEKLMPEVRQCAR